MSVFELEEVGGLVRIVAFCAWAVGSRLMRKGVGVYFFMALITECFNIGDRLKCMLVFLVLLMAEGAVACGHRSVDKFIFSHDRVAL